MLDVFSDKAKEAVFQSLRHVYRIECQGRDLDIEDASLSFDESHSPHVTLNARCKFPEDQAYLDSLDPRLKPRVLVYVGYVYAGGEEDMHLVANLSLTSRTVSRPSNSMSLVAESDEVLVGEFGWSYSDWIFGTNFDPIAAIALIIQTCSPGSTVSIETTRPNLTYEVDNPYTIVAGDDPMRAVVDLADQSGSLWIRDEGFRNFRITDRPAIGTAAHILTVGQNGTLAASNTEMSRDNWGNAVHVRHRWRNTVDNVEVIQDGYAEATGGPYAVATVGRTLFNVERSTPASLDTATTSAQSILARVVSRGRSFELDAISAYWLRPGDTITGQLPQGPQERVLVAAVRFSIPDGLMRIVTRLPEDLD